MPFVDPAMIANACSLDPSLCFADPGFNIQTKPGPQISSDLLASLQDQARVDLAQIGTGINPLFVVVGVVTLAAILFARSNRR